MVLGKGADGEIERLEQQPDSVNGMEDCIFSWGDIVGTGGPVIPVGEVCGDTGFP